MSLKDNADDTQAIVFAQGPSGAIQQNVAAPYRNVLAGMTLEHWDDLLVRYLEAFPASPHHPLR